MLKKILILVLILAVPGFLYYLLTIKGKNRYKPLPIYGPKVVAKTGHKFHGKFIPDTIYHKLPAFKVVDQNGDTVADNFFDKRIFVASFFYTNCSAVCATINKNIKSFSENYGNNKLIWFASFTVDPDRDNAGVLKAYSKQLSAGPHWRFLTGDTTQVYNLARNGFLVNAVALNKDEFIYSDKLILVDSEKRIRGYYSGASTQDMRRLDDEIKVLVAEELRKKEAPLY